MNQRLQVTVGLAWGLASVLAVVAGSLGPWVTVGPFSVGGFAADGKISLAAGVLAAIGVLWRSVPRAVVLVLAAIAAATAVYDTAAIFSTDSTLFGSVAPGWGIIVAGLGAISLAAWAVAASLPSQLVPGLAGAALVALVLAGVAGSATTSDETPAKAEAAETTTEDAAPAPAPEPEPAPDPVETTEPDVGPLVMPSGEPPCPGSAIVRSDLTVEQVTAVGPTSCPFARNVARAAATAFVTGDATDLDDFEVAAFSPVTSTEITMSCTTYAPRVIQCSGGNGAQVEFGISE
jgi:hypothetical protein